MNNYLLQYQNYLVNDKKASVNTVDAYIRDVNNYLIFCAFKEISDIASAETKTVKLFIEELKKAGKSDSSVQRIISSVRSFYRFLIKKGYCEKNPTDFAKMSKEVKSIPGILSKEEVLLLLAQPKGNDLKSIRDKAILELMYATGLKVSELISLKVSDVNLQIGLLNISTDIKHIRVVPIYQGAVRSLNNYIKNVRPLITADNLVDELFTNMNGKPMSRQGLWKIIKYYVSAAGIDKDITPHTLRHSFAAHLLENGADIKDIKEMLGHLDISSTQIYSQIIKARYTKNYEKFHPLGNKN